VTVVLLALSCRHAPAPEAPAPGGLPEGSACLSPTDCATGLCEGEGCGDDTPGICVGSRACTRDLRPYCGCDGETFRTSGSCPNRRFAYRGECDAVPLDDQP
jgi:hypothetical protein